MITVLKDAKYIKSIVSYICRSGKKYGPMGMPLLYKFS